MIIILKYVIKPDGFPAMKKKKSRNLKCKRKADFRPFEDLN